MRDLTDSEWALVDAALGLYIAQVEGWAKSNPALRVEWERTAVQARTLRNELSEVES